MVTKVSASEVVRKFFVAKDVLVQKKFCAQTPNKKIPDAETFRLGMKPNPVQNYYLVNQAQFQKKILIKIFIILNYKGKKNLYKNYIKII